MTTSEAPKLVYRNATLAITPLGDTTVPARVWDFLPSTQGSGWVELTDHVQRFEPGRREGVLLNAEVADGTTTVIVRFSCGRWTAWRLTELDHDAQTNTSKGECYETRFIEESYLSSAPQHNHQTPRMRYRTYWRRVDKDGVGVWTPFASRFCQWED